ncbi:MAG: hypothetical protein U0353_31910 [Sandaracinus sp.]
MSNEAVLGERKMPSPTGLLFLPPSTLVIWLLGNAALGWMAGTRPLLATPWLGFLLTLLLIPSLLGFRFVRFVVLPGFLMLALLPVFSLTREQHIVQTGPVSVEDRGIYWNYGLLFAFYVGWYLETGVRAWIARRRQRLVSDVAPDQTDRADHHDDRGGDR